MRHTTRSTGNPDEVEYIIVVGKTRYEAGRQFPWVGQHGGVYQYFKTEAEAVEFARRGDNYACS